jgi:hypothetical protein
LPPAHIHLRVSQKMSVVCGVKFYCEIYKKQSRPRIEYMRIYNGSISEQIEVFRKFETNLEIREFLKNENFLPCDPLFSLEYSYGLNIYIDTGRTEYGGIKLSQRSLLPVCFTIKRPNSPLGKNNCSFSYLVD